ncbi:MAG: PHP domain-containing protein [Acutalibacteraceae bacterium]|jgi:hypothetical protein
MFKFEIHLHTKNCSACSDASPEDMVNAAVQYGYSGFVVTNHFYHGNTCVDRNLPWEDFIGAYEKDYLEAKEIGEKKGVQVFFGIEEGFAPGKEMLIYGIAPKIFKESPEFIMMSAKEKSEFVRKNGGLCVCAHPFRHRGYIPNPETPPNPDLFDGIEGYNYFNTPDDNEKAFIYGLNNNKIITSGSDVHHAEDFGNAGIAFERPIKNYADFLKRLKSCNFRLITPYGID